jgi:hypothetical protein
MADTFKIDWDKVGQTKVGNALDLTDALEVPENVLKKFKSTKGLGRSIASSGQAPNGAVRTVDGKVYIVRKDLNGIK